VSEEINGHRLAPVSSSGRPAEEALVCLRCGAHFVDRSESAFSVCPADGNSPGHELVRNPSDGLLYCTRCPMIAYDLADAATDPQCPLPLQPWSL
jgi:uncharacterized C2H2 Zn-finger protein